MSNDPITCHCDEGCGLPHVHRNPPYDTEGRNELHRKMRDQRVPEPRTPMPVFEDEETDSTFPPPKEEESQCGRSSKLESCVIGPSHGGENQDNAGENSSAQKTSDVADLGDAGLCDDGSDSDKDETIKQEVKSEDEQSFCDLGCGRAAVVKVGRLNLCEPCPDERSIDIPGPRPRLEDVVVPDRTLEDEVL